MSKSPLYLRYVLAVGAFVLMVNCNSAMATNDTNEVWVTATNSASYLSSGTYGNFGTITNPYYGDFDAIINSLPTNTTIHLLPGTFYTVGAAGGLTIKAGQKIVGAGRDTTVVKLSNTNSFIGVFDSDANRVEVSNLTIDANSAGNETHRYGVRLRGCDCSVRRVRVIKTVGTGSQVRPILTGNVGGTNSLVEDCEVSSVFGNYATGISLYGQGIIRNCRVSLPVVTNTSGTYLVSYYASQTYGALFDGNIGDGGTMGFYSPVDGGGETNLMIINCHLSRCIIGIFIQKDDSAASALDGISIRNNTIEIASDVPSGAYSIGMYISMIDNSHARLFRNIAIVGNTLQYYQNVGGAVQQSGSIIVYNYDNKFATNLFNVRICDNTVERAMISRGEFSLGYGNWFAGNIDQLGNTYDFLRLTGSGTVYLDQLAEKVQVTPASSTADIYFSNAWGFSGKKVTIMNLRSSGSVTMHAISGESVSGSTTLAAGKTAKFVSDGISAWVREAY